MSYLDPELEHWLVRAREAIRKALGLLALASAVPIGFLALASVMLFDAPGSEANILNWAFVFGCWLAPGALIYGGILCAFRDSRRDFAVGSTLIGAAALYFSVLWSISELICNGSTVCGAV